MRVCPKCRRSLPLVDFYESKGKVSSWCKECMREANRAYARRNKAVRNKRIVTSRRAGQLGLTYDEYVALPSDPGRMCAVCGCSPADRRNGAWSDGTAHRPTKNLSVDHDHTTGRIRGFLCSNCNRALGLLEDNPGWCRALADYVSTGGLGWEPRPKLTTGRRPSPTCGQGHEMEGRNLIILPGGERRCRECSNRRARQYGANRRAKAKADQQQK